MRVTDHQLIKALRPELAPLLTPNMAIYWSYFSLASLCAWASFVGAAASERGPAFVACFAIGVLSLYHAVTFTHELSHLDRDKHRAFYWAWNLIIGIPFAMPAFLYGDTHLEHHGRPYGTARDAEYLNFRRGPTLAIAGFLAANLVLPPLALLRVAVLGPLSLLHQRLRFAVLRELSSMGMRTPFKRTLPIHPEVLRSWAANEVLGFGFFAGVTVLMGLGIVEWSTVLIWWGLVTCVGLLNGIRALAVTHRYWSLGEAVISWGEQIEDCVEIERSSLATFVFCPVGTQFHLTHHLFPAMPFHNLKKARRLISERLMGDSFYFQNVRRGITHGLRMFLAGVYHPPAKPAPARGELMLLAGSGRGH